MKIESVGEQQRNAKQLKYDTLWMDQAVRLSQMSYAKRKKVGSVLVLGDTPISSGWNGMPRGFPNDCELPDGSTNPLVVHAELNVFLNCLRNGSDSVKGGTVYITMSPCANCAAIMIQAEVARVVYLEEYRILDGIEILNRANILVEQFKYEG